MQYFLAASAWGIGASVFFLATGQINSLWSTIPTIVGCTTVGLIAWGISAWRQRRLEANSDE